MSDVLNITVSERARQEFANALAAQGGDDFGIRIDAFRISPVRLNFQLALDPVDGRRPEDVETTVEGLRIWASPASAELLDGATVDYVEELHGAGFKIDQPKSQKTWTDPVAIKLHQLLETEINPGIASHGGFIDLVDYRDGRAYLFMGGGCQGCGMANVTLREGVEARVREAIPEVVEIVDVTDHASGANPYM